MLTFEQLDSKRFDSSYVQVIFFFLVLGTCKYYLLIFVMALVTVWDEQEDHYEAAAVIQERDPCV